MDVLYLCDKKACGEVCPNSECEYTLDPCHAVNFEDFGGRDGKVLARKEKKEEVCEPELFKDIDEEDTVFDVFKSLNYQQKEMSYAVIGYALETGKNILTSKSITIDNHKSRKLRLIYNTLNEQQKTVVDYLIKEARKEFKEGSINK